MAALTQPAWIPTRSQETIAQSIASKVRKLLCGMRITEQDCGSVDGIYVSELHATGEIIESLRERIAGRIAGRDLTDSAGRLLLCANKTITSESAATVKPHDPCWDDTRVLIRSLHTCEAERGLCASCYGCYPGTDRLVEVGEDVGSLAAEAIATGLYTIVTCRTPPRMEWWYRNMAKHFVDTYRPERRFADIPEGSSFLDRLFEVRKPYCTATLAIRDGVVRIRKQSKRAVCIEIVDKNGAKSEQVIPLGNRILQDIRGRRVRAGEALTSGERNLHDILSILGEKELCNYLMLKFQDYFTFFGATISDKHFELLFRQMMCWVYIEDAGDTCFYVGEIVKRTTCRYENERVIEAGGTPAMGRPALIGLTKILQLLDQQRQPERETSKIAA